MVTTRLLNKQEIKEAKRIVNEVFYHPPQSGHVWFGCFDLDLLIAVATLRCYHGYWFLRGAFVEPKYRGKHIQRKLIRARLKYLQNNTHATVAKAHILPKNTYSQANILACGFKQTKNKNIKGVIFNVFQKEIKR